MKLHRWILSIFVGFFILTLSLGVAIYDIIVFQPCKQRIDTILIDVSQSYKVKTKLISDLVNISEGTQNVRNYVTRKLLSRCEFDKHPMVLWHLEYGMWSLLVNIHYKDSDILALWIALAPYEKGRGLNNSSLYHYGRNLDRLNPEELATVITIARNPSLYGSNPQKLEERVRILLQRYENKRN